MVGTRFSLYTTEKRVEQCNKFIDNKRFNAVSDVINTAIDKALVLEFITHVGVSLFWFLAGVGLTLNDPGLYFYVLTVGAGIYLVISFSIFYNKYKGVKWLLK